VVRRPTEIQGCEGGTVAADIPAADYAQYIGEAALRDSYLKAPYFKPQAYPAGIYRVGPLARLNVAEQTGTPLADRELAEYRQRFGPVVHIPSTTTMRA